MTNQLYTPTHTTYVYMENCSPVRETKPYYIVDYEITVLLLYIYQLLYLRPYNSLTLVFNNLTLSIYQLQPYLSVTYVQTTSIS